MKIYLDTVGCRLNQSEIETYARQFRAAGHDLVSDPGEADLTVVNTCTVTNAAAKDSRKKIRGAARAGSKEIIVTGCWSALDPEAAADLPKVRQVIPNLTKDTLVAKVLDISPEAFDLEPLVRQPVPGSRLRTRAFIKVQDGCDNRCTFCVTTLARGKGRSITVADILADIRAAVNGGAQEIVLTGVHLGSWGHDLEPQQHIRDLVKTVLKAVELPRLRLSSLEPWDLDADFFALWEDSRLARHLHLPLQSGSAATLKRMARKTTPMGYAKLLNAARLQIPDVAITTDVIVGFPGESDREFEESLEFVKAMQFSGGHVFTYSARPETAAASMPDQVPHPVRKERSQQMRAILMQAETTYRNRFVGDNIAVLWETAQPLKDQLWRLGGLTDNYLRVHADGPRRFWNQITPVKLVGVQEKGLQGVLLQQD